MLVLRLTSEDGSKKFYTDSTNLTVDEAMAIFREAMDRDGELYWVDELEMSEDEYQRIRASSGSAEFFGGEPS